MEKNLLINLPFPYFLVNKEFEVLFASNNIKDLSIKNIKDILDPSSLPYFQSFIYESPTNSSMMIKLYLHQPVIYRLYKTNDETEQSYHLYCFPLESSTEEVFALFEQIEEKMSKFKRHLAKKKEYFEQAAALINENTMYYQNSVNIGKLAAGIAHEIRNPLTTVKGFIQLLKPFLTDIDKEEYAKIALEELDRANEIIYQFLNATKPQEGRKEDLSINQLVKEIVLLYESEAILRNVSLVLELSENHPKVYFNRYQLKQVLINIIKNALEAIDEKTNKHYGVICIKTYSDDNWVTISIIDNGCGMTEETLSNLFSPFYSTKSAGTGIGLPICKEIIEEFGGNISAKSKIEEETEFIINIPRTH